jgi:hypothetical protein
MHITIKDAVKEITLCHNCMAMAFLDNEISLINDPQMIDDISGDPGAVEFIAHNERYFLDRHVMMRLISYNLKRHEYLILADKYGTDKYMLRDDFYWNDGTQLQSILDDI